MIVIGEERLRELVGPADLLESQAEAMRAYSAGTASVPPVGIVDLGTGSTHIKSAYVAGGEYFAVKVVSAFAAAPRAATGTSGGFIAVCSATDGHPVAMLTDGGWLTDARTTAAGVVATQALARPDATRLAVIGAGVQAGMQARAIAAARQLDEIHVWARNEERRADFVAALAADLPGVRVTGVVTAREAVDAADIVLTATLSHTPLVRGEWLRPGQHITAIGSDEPGGAELDAEALKRADRLVVDSLSQNLVLGDVSTAIAAGGIKADDVDGELGEVLLGRIPSRRNPDEITVVKLTGIGVQDLTAAIAALRIIEENGS